jgi:ATP-binding cassette subfamily B protein
MALAVPFYKQEDEYTCGPVCLKMVSEFYHKKYSKAFLKKLARTTESHGTSTKNMESVMKRLGFTVVTQRNSTLKDIEMFITLGHPVVVLYTEPGTWAHYGVVTKITKHHVYIHDPYRKPLEMFTRKAFAQRWSPKGRARRWMMVIQEKQKT